MAYVQIGQEETNVWPPEDAATSQRLKDYEMNRLLFKGKHHDVFERVDEWLRREEDKTLIYIVCNFAGLISRVSADMLFGEAPGYVIGDYDSPEQGALTQIVSANGLNALNYEMALSGSWRGETVYKVRYGQPTSWKNEDARPIIYSISPEYYFPLIDPEDIRSVSGGVFGWILNKEEDKSYLRIERQLPGEIHNELYLLKGESIKDRVPLRTLDEYAGLEDVQETGYPGLLFEFCPNWRLEDEYWGNSDYSDLGSVFDELNNRVSRISRVLDKHESPRLVLPPGIMKWDERNGRWYIEKEDIEAMEVDPEEEAGNLPRYLTWDAQLDAAYKHIDKLMEFVFMVSETSPDAFGMGKHGVAESGRALKFRLIRLLGKVNRKKLYFDNAIKNILYKAMYLQHIKEGTPSVEDKIYIEWKDGMPDDALEGAQIEQIRTGNKATTSRRSAIRRLDRLEGEQLEEEIEEINTDEEIDRVDVPLDFGGLEEEGEEVEEEIEGAI